MRRRELVQICLITPLLFVGCLNDSASQAEQDAVPSGIDAAEPDALPCQINNSDDGESMMYGRIAKMEATRENRDKLIEILLNGTKDMPGCKLYAIAADASDQTGIWITEIWDSEASHQASLQLPSVQKAIAEGKPMIAGFGDRHVVTPRGGFGVS